MEKFDVTVGNTTFFVPTEIMIDDEIIYLDESNVQDRREDYEGNLSKIELAFETMYTGMTVLSIEKNLYNEPTVFFGTLDETESAEGLEYEHPEDRPYDALPEGDVPYEFQDNILIVENDDSELEDE